MTLSFARTTIWLCLLFAISFSQASSQDCDVCHDFWQPPTGSHQFCGPYFMEAGFPHCEMSSGVCISHPPCNTVPYDGLEDRMLVEALLIGSFADIDMILQGYRGDRVNVSASLNEVVVLCPGRLLATIKVPERLGRHVAKRLAGDPVEVHEAFYPNPRSGVGTMVWIHPSAAQAARR